jgi:pimeloyl-ACP methyl ester carboxylesterase
MSMVVRFVAVVLALWLGGTRARGDEPTSWAGSIELPGGIVLEFSVALTSDSGTITIPLQKVSAAELSGVSASAKELKFTLKNPGGEKAHANFELQVAEDGKSAAGLLKQMGGEFGVRVRRLEAGEHAATELKRPQEPKAPFPYTSEDVGVAHARAGIVLAGTLTIPLGDGPHPGVVMITGSGAQDRDETILGHKPFWVIADHLSRHGIAVLRMDDRGVGKSMGSIAGATSDDFAKDIGAAIEYMRTRKEIDSKRLGLVGHSEGGLIAPMVAAEDAGIAFIVLLAGPGIPGSEILPLQSRLIARANGATEAEAEAQTKQMVEIFAMLKSGKGQSEMEARIREMAIEEMKESPEGRARSDEDRGKKADELARDQAAALMDPWMRRFIAYDPRPTLAKVKCPVLALNGEKDLQVPPRENLGEIEKALRGAGNTKVTIAELPGLNHLFQHCTTGALSEYGTIEETFSRGALDQITTWIGSQCGMAGESAKVTPETK